ncbi:hypothetical protein A0J61_04480 [Choanephora cucurbitarum]|uniref:Uncharacterized protein n=1 Tax=Choanephora cucurbitarum TaxID=101091 RepID=A0A1C7NFC9_9FUNG|nr:hypothetical protein A0J61_04480 [Choanephora cucurbitarum]
MLQQEYTVNLYDIVESLTKLFGNFNSKETSIHSFIETECNLLSVRATSRSSERNFKDELRQR